MRLFVTFFFVLFVCPAWAADGVPASPSQPLVPPSSYKGPAEIELRDKLQRLIADLFARNKFSELNDLEEQYRTHHDKLPDGTERLEVFYTTLNVIFAGARTDAQRPTIDHTLQAWNQTAPSPAATIAAAARQMQQAYALRDQDLGNEKNPHSWDPFHRALQQAMDLLKAHPGAQVDPEWYRIIIEVVRYAQWFPNEYGPIFDEAIARHPDYYPIYRTIFFSLEPRWIGSYDQMRHFADYAAQKTGATDGKSFYARLYIDLVENGNDLISFAKPDWGIFRAATKDFLTLYGSPLNYSRVGYVACRAQDRELVASVIRGAEPVFQGWHDSDAQQPNFKACKNWAVGP